MGQRGDLQPNAYPVARRLRHPGPVMLAIECVGDVPGNNALLITPLGPGFASLFGGGVVPVGVPAMLLVCGYRGTECGACLLYTSPSPRDS